MSTRLFLLFTLVLGQALDAAPYPIQFCIPESKIVEHIPEKTQDLATVSPYDRSTYIFNDEESYYKDYQKSYYALTCKKAGWDCMRHYEILACGCIPYFVDLDRCPKDTMIFFPRELIQEAMHLKGVTFSYVNGKPHISIDHTIFDVARYYQILEQLLDFTRSYLTTKQIAQYVLDTVGYKGKGTILFITGSRWPDYMRCLLLTGLKQLLPGRIVDSPKIDHLFTSYPKEALLGLYGKGISYGRNLEDEYVDRGNIEERIKNHEFDLVIYGSFHRGRNFHDLVLQYYTPDEIIYVCGEDIHTCEYYNYHNLFLRELDLGMHK